MMAYRALRELYDALLSFCISSASVILSCTYLSAGGVAESMPNRKQVASMTIQPTMMMMLMSGAEFAISLK